MWWHVWIRVSVADCIRQPAALCIDRNIGSCDKTANRIASSRIFPAKSSSKKLIPSLLVDLGKKLRLRKGARERRQTRLRIIESAATGAIRAHRIEHCLRLRECIRVREGLGLDQQRFIREINRKRSLRIRISRPQVEQCTYASGHCRRWRHEVLPALISRIHRQPVL